VCVFGLQLSSKLCVPLRPFVILATHVAYSRFFYFFSLFFSALAPVGPNFVNSGYNSAKLCVETRPLGRYFVFVEGGLRVLPHSTLQYLGSSLQTLQIIYVLQLLCCHAGNRFRANSVYTGDLAL